MTNVGLEHTLTTNFPSIKALLIQDSKGLLYVYEGAPNAARALRRVASIAKSFTALLVGRAIQDGLLKSPDEVLLSQFPNLVTGDVTELRTTTLTHLLTMTSGLLWDENNLDTWYRSPEHKFPMRFATAPKARGAFSYNTAASHLAGAILSEIVGRSLDSYAQETLLTPLGIEEVAWTKDPQGFCFGGHALRLRPIDCAKLGTLLLSNGTHGNMQLLPSFWPRECSTPRVFANWPFESQYGYSWWNTSWGYMAFGYGGQILAVNPTANRTMVISSEMDQLHDEYLAALVDPLMRQEGPPSLFETSLP